MFPKAQMVLDEDNPIVLLNEGPSSASNSSKPPLSVDRSSDIQAASICDHKGKGTHGLIVVKNFCLIKRIGMSLKMNLISNFLEFHARKDQFVIHRRLSESICKLTNECSLFMD